MPKLPQAPSVLEETLALQLRAFKVTGYEREYKFNSKRKWRFDFAWLDKKIAVECEGGTHAQGRHTRGEGFEKDCEKYNEATAQGWKVYRFTMSQIKSGYAIDFIDRALREAGE